MPPDKPSSPPDPTPIVGAATDVSPLTHSGPKPAHERTAAEEAGAVDWEASAGGERAIQGAVAFQTPFHHPGNDRFHRLLLRPSGAGWLCPAIDGEARSRTGQPRISLRALAVFHGLDHRRSLRPCSQSL